MTVHTSFTIDKRAAVFVVVGLLLLGGGATYYLMRGDGRTAAATNASAGRPALESVPSGPVASIDRPLPDIVVPIAKDAIDRAGIVVSPVAAGGLSAELRLPGIVEPNAYRQVVVTPLVAGRITRVLAELGGTIRRGQSLAEIYSPELAEAETRYVAARAMLDAHERELQRTQRLVDIGAASRQELERLHAEHAAQSATVESAQSQLRLLGVSAATLADGKGINATISVPAPNDGVITERSANIGLNVDPSTALFKIVDLSTVWIVADVYEKDFARVRVGSRAVVTTAAYPDLVLEAHVSYIDPQVNRETRTAKVRVELANPRNQLRLGMFADVVVTSAGTAATPAVPQRAVQNVGDRSVVYLVNANEPGRFIEREVHLGATSADQVEVTHGVQAGDVVVSEGSFFIRAERERLGLRAADRATGTATAAGAPANTVQTAKITVTEQGFEPAKIELRAGAPARLTFLRTTDKTCATEVVFPSMGIKRPLPLNQPVVIDLASLKTGDLSFACGINMFLGSVVVR
jgi:membrane fusion protein, heavy metal efflux system